jgi:hypothetical protein
VFVTKKYEAFKGYTKSGSAITKLKFVTKYLSLDCQINYDE